MTSSMRDDGLVQRRLKIVRWLGLVDLVLLAMLITSALAGQRGLVQVLGPIHGVHFLLLLAVATTGALDGLWRWWFPAAILVTAGPPGAFLGEWLITRRMQRPSTERNNPCSE